MLNMTTYYPLQKLRKIPGLEHAKYVDPYAGSKGNSIRYLSVAPRTNDMKVVGVDNLFCAGEKSGLLLVILKQFVQVHWQDTMLLDL